MPVLSTRQAPLSIGGIDLSQEWHGLAGCSSFFPFNPLLQPGPLGQWQELDRLGN